MIEDNQKSHFRQILLTESTNSPIGMKGSLITHFAHYLHGSFQYSADWLISQNNLDANSAGAKFIHEYFKMLTAGMTGDSISLLDVPALMSKSQPFINVLEVCTQLIVICILPGGGNQAVLCCSKINVPVTELIMI